MIGFANAWANVLGAFSDIFQCAATALNNRAVRIKMNIYAEGHPSNGL